MSEDEKVIHNHFYVDVHEVSAKLRERVMERAKGRKILLGYPTLAHDSIPVFHTYEEEATFWDTHDFTDFWNATEGEKQ